MEIKFPSVPIFKSSLQVLVCCWKIHTVTFFVCLFCVEEHIPSPQADQVCHFPLRLLNASYSNGMFSEFTPFLSLELDDFGRSHRSPSFRVPQYIPNYSCRKCSAIFSYENFTLKAATCKRVDLTV